MRDYDDIIEYPMTYSVIIWNRFLYFLCHINWHHYNWKTSLQAQRCNCLGIPSYLLLNFYAENDFTKIICVELFLGFIIYEKLFLGFIIYTTILFLQQRKWKNSVRSNLVTFYTTFMPIRLIFATAKINDANDCIMITKTYVIGHLLLDLLN